MPLPRVHRVVQDSLGNVVPQVLCSVLLEGTGTLATLWQDDAGTIPMSNPMTSDATYGSFDFYVQPAHYDLTFTKPGYTFQPLLDMQVPQDDLTLGTMAQQDASAVAITGGSAVGLTQVSTNLLTVPDRAGTPVVATDLQVTAGAGTRFNLYVPGTAPNFLNGRLHLATQTPLGAQMGVYYSGQHGVALLPASDAGTFWALLFVNTAQTPVGSISTTVSGTAFNTTSDGRLKKDVTPLAGALDAVRRLRPITHLWTVDDSRGYGFVAHEVQDTLPADAGVVIGERDAVDEAGQIVPQMIDYSKLVPFLTAAIQDLAAQVQALTARLEACGG